MDALSRSLHLAHIRSYIDPHPGTVLGRTPAKRRANLLVSYIQLHHVDIGDYLIAQIVDTLINHALRYDVKLTRDGRLDITIWVPNEDKPLEFWLDAADRSGLD